MISVNHTFHSPRFTDEIIPVEFLILHYTGCSLKQTLEIFCKPEAQVCAHFVIDSDGSLYDLGQFWDGVIRRGAHAGKSRFQIETSTWDEFNKISIGVELVNLNGNLFAYPEAQYQTLFKLTRHLKERFSSLEDPNRIVGHEQISSFRGKCDPGTQFDWEYFFRSTYPRCKIPERVSLFTPGIWERFEKEFGPVQISQMTEDDWPKLSTQMELFLNRLNPS